MQKETILTYLRQELTIPVRDPLWKNIYISPALKKITESPDFLKLHNIRQLGPTYLVYPGATHSRANHSLGVFYMAVKMIKSLISTSIETPMRLEDVKAFLAAALLHDLGHFPYTHSFKELPLREHEELTGEIILKDPIYTLLKEDNIVPEDVAAIIDSNRPIPDGSPLHFFRNILSGVLDPDKLDYLNRDAYFCGVPYGIQDTDFIFRQLTFHPENGIALKTKGIMAIENILFSKYQMYKSVYWHSQVRLSTAMVKKGVYQSLQSGEIKSEDLYNLDDSSFRNMAAQMHSLSGRLIHDSEIPGSYHCVLEIPFDEDNRSHDNLADLNKRMEFEGIISHELKKKGYGVTTQEVILDIPEKISLEVSFPITEKENDLDFMKSATPFKKEVIGHFEKNLRKIRLFLPVEHQISPQALSDII